MQRSLLRKRLLGIFLIAFVLLNFPILNIWAGEKFVVGFPTLYLGIFGIWTALIGLLYWVVSRKSHQKTG